MNYDVRIWRISDELGSRYHFGTPDLASFFIVGTFSTDSLDRSWRFVVCEVCHAA